MNCNSNTMPLITMTENGGRCTNNCVPLDISVVCKKMLVPQGQNVLGIQGETNVSTRNFLLPKVTEEDIDLSQANFQILYQIGGEIKQIEIDKNNVEELENNIKIKWIIDSSITEISGNVTIQIVATGENYVWKTYPTTFVIIKSL